MGQKDKAKEQRLIGYREASRIADDYAGCGQKEKTIEILQEQRTKAQKAGDKAYALFFEAELANYLTDDPQKAIDILEKAIQHEKDEFLLRCLGVYHAQKGDQDAAIQLYDAALAINPKDGDVLRDKGASLSKKGDEDAAIQLYDAALAINPKDCNALRNKGVSLSKKGDEDAAIQLYDAALAINPKDYAALRQKGVSLSMKGMRNAAIQLYDAAWRLIQKMPGLGMENRLLNLIEGIEIKHMSISLKRLNLSQRVQ